MNPIPVFQKIVRTREQLNLPNVLSNAPYTLAILQLGPHEVYGMNTYGQDGRAAGLPKGVRQFMNDLCGATQSRGKQFSFGISGSLAHAEGDALVTAWNNGLTKDFKQGVMFVDREVCPLCRGPGGLPRLLTIIGMQHVIVYELLDFPASYNCFQVVREP